MFAALLNIKNKNSNKEIQGNSSRRIVNEPVFLWSIEFN